MWLIHRHYVLIKCSSQRFVEIFDVLNMESFAESSEKVETLRFLNVGSQFFDFFKSLTKIQRNGS